jgi:hypothetical protein
MTLIEGLDHVQAFVRRDAVLPHVAVFLRQVEEGRPA